MSDQNSEDERPLPMLSSSASLRKRSRASRTSVNTISSDPVYFSSDDLAEASVENYVSPRRKKHYKRTWYEDEDTSTLVSHDARKRAAKRAKDSGVFMSSDSSSSGSIDDGLSIAPLKAKYALMAKTKFAASMEPPISQLARAVMDSGELHARNVIAQCLENDDEAVMLNACSLSSLSNETLRPLRHLIKPPRVHSSQSDEAYQSFAPELKLILSSNQLKSVPGEIAHLTNLTLLSLRNNKISELPQSLGSLQKLHELNVANNRIRWLPWELLRLGGSSGTIENLIVTPNPLLMPLPSAVGKCKLRRPLEEFPALQAKLKSLTAEALDQFDECAAQRLLWLAKLYQAIEHAEKKGHNSAAPLTRRPAIYIASTPVSYLELDGSVSRTAHPAPSRLPHDICVLPAAPAAQTRSQTQEAQAPWSSRAPSLYELSLRLVSRHMAFTELDKYLTDNMPERVTIGLQTARIASEQGGTRCSVCTREYVIARAEWIEYWHCAPDCFTCSYDELFLPFLRRSCSWSCAEEVIAERRRVEGESSPCF